MPIGHRTLIVGETLGHRLTAFDIQEDGSLSNRRVWAQLPASVGPDGICLDAEGAADQLLRMGIAGPQTDQVGLTRALRKMLRKYSGLPLKEIVASEVLNDVQPIIYEYKLHVQSDYWLLIKTLVTMEGVGKALSPDFDVFAASAPQVQRFLVKEALPQSWAPGVFRQAMGWVTVVSLFPRQATRVMGRLSNVLDLFLAAHHARQQAQQAPMIFLHQQIEGAFVAVAGALHQLPI